MKRNCRVQDTKKVPVADRQHECLIVDVKSLRVQHEAWLFPYHRVDEVDVQDADEKSGVEIVRRAIEEPARWLAANAGMEGAVVVEHIRAEKPGVGYDVADGRVTNMLKAGIIDATKVTRLALQNAASVASLLLTTEALLVEKRDKKAAATPGGYNPEDMNM